MIQSDSIFGTTIAFQIFRFLAIFDIQSFKLAIEIFSTTFKHKKGKFLSISFNIEYMIYKGSTLSIVTRPGLWYSFIIFILFDTGAVI